MTTEKLWDQYQDYTRDLTEHSRKLAFAVAAICWFFRTPQITFPPAILWSLALLICFFVLDVLHYFIGAFFVRLFLEHHEKAHYEKTGTELKEIPKPRWVDYPATFFFITKTLVLLSSFVALGTEFYYRIFLDR
jgi:hypothetical protein